MENNISVTNSSMDSYFHPIASRHHYLQLQSKACCPIDPALEAFVRSLRLPCQLQRAWPHNPAGGCCLSNRISVFHVPVPTKLHLETSSTFSNFMTIIIFIYKTWRNTLPVVDSVHFALSSRERRALSAYQELLVLFSSRGRFHSGPR